VSPLRLSTGFALASVLIGLIGCKSKQDSGASGAASGGPALEYGPPVGARVSGNARVASFEIALAAKGASPDDCLPMAIQAVSNMSANCPGVPTELAKKGQVAITFETIEGQLDPSQVSSEYFDDAGLDCVRGELKKALGKLPHQQKVKYLLQVRPLTS
jgi:hypothetical protein